MRVPLTAPLSSAVSSTVPSPVPVSLTLPVIFPSRWIVPFHVLPAEDKAPHGIVGVPTEEAGDVGAVPQGEGGPASRGAFPAPEHAAARIKTATALHPGLFVDPEWSAAVTAYFAL
jgi:hypothetical protein